MKHYDAIIIGGGIIGCTIARSLANQSMKVAIIERGKPGEEASWAAAGMLAPSAEAEAGSPLFPLCRASLKMYRSFAADLQSETGIDPQYRSEGALLLYEDERERAAMLPSIEWQRGMGIPIEELSSADLRKEEPELAPCAGGFHVPEDHRINNRLLMRAVISSCQRRGVNFLLGQAAREVQHNGRAASGVVLETGSVAAGSVINSAGAWAGCIAVQGRQPEPIRPVKGQMVALENSRPLLGHVIRTHKAYVVPRENGSIIIGSTMEDAGFDKTPRAGAIAKLLRAAQHLCPALEQSTIKDFWAGLRPATPDELSLLGPTALDGYWVALGHFRNGILLTPITAQVVSSWLLNGKPSLPVDALAPQRFER